MSEVLNEYWSANVAQTMNQVTYEHGMRQYGLDCDVYAIATAPHRNYPTTVTLDGNMYCCLYGEDLQVGIAGFGKTPKEACAEFDRIWNEGEAEVGRE